MGIAQRLEGRTPPRGSRVMADGIIAHGSRSGDSQALEAYRRGKARASSRSDRGRARRHPIRVVRTSPPAWLDLHATLDRRGPSDTFRDGVLRVLLVEDDPTDAELAQDRLADRRGPGFRVVHEKRVADALARLAAGGIDVVLLDLDLPDSRGLSTCERVVAAHPDVPVVVLTGLDDEMTGLRAVKRGAQDFLSKERLDAESLLRALRYAVERHAMKARVESAAREARDSETRLRNLIGRSAEGFLVIDDAHTVRFVNPAAAALLGSPAEDLLNRPLALPFPNSATREFLVRRGDGSSVSAEVRVTALEWEGGASALISLHDLSDRKRAERIEVAQAIQRAFLPERAEWTAGALAMRARNELCEDASGDYYDVVSLDDGRVAVAIGDVTGHGLGPALLMAQGRAYLRAFCRTVATLGGVMERLNDALAADMTNGRFMTLFIAILDPVSGAISWANAGHVPALVRRARSGAVEALEPTGMVLGVFPGQRFEVRDDLTLEPGDVLLLCSDGATEAAGPDGEMFGDERVRAVLRDTPSSAPDDVLDSMREAIAGWTAGRALADDLTLMAVCRGLCAETPTERGRDTDAS
jgi:serine phosphatase RsbU (regulator of sigma subunit)/CheY-like chemotaxis protein